MKIRRNANDALMCVNCSADTSQDGGNRIITVLNKTAVTIVTMKGTKMRNDNQTREYHFVPWAGDMGDQH